MCPIQFFFRFTTASTKLLSSPIASSTSFLFLSSQLIFSILLHIHISKAFSLSISIFLNVHVSTHIVPQAISELSQVFSLLPDSFLQSLTLSSFVESFLAYGYSLFYIINASSIFRYNCSQIFKLFNLLHFLSFNRNLNRLPFCSRHYHSFCLLHIYFYLIIFATSFSLSINLLQCLNIIETSRRNFTT